jgi:hypothetical protein
VCVRLIGRGWYCELQNTEVKVVYQHFHHEPSGKLEFQAAASGWPRLLPGLGENPKSWTVPLWPLPLLMAAALLGRSVLNGKAGASQCPG